MPNSATWSELEFKSLQAEVFQLAGADKGGLLNPATLLRDVPDLPKLDHLLSDPLGTKLTKEHADMMATILLNSHLVAASQNNHKIVNFVNTLAKSFLDNQFKVASSAS